MQGLLRQRTSDVTFQDIEEACATRDAAVALLDHYARVARPGESVASLLLLAAPLATRPWIRGPVRVRLTEAGDAIRVDVSEHLDAASKAVTWSGVIGAPIRELVDVLPHLGSQLAPLRVLAQRDDALVLGMRGVRASLPPPVDEPLPDTRPAGALPISDLPDASPESVDELDEGW
ncbi:MAG: hypothetical protein IT374_02550 [Polyangiaceae bacterium]|nr:hypothetical protein [Polyangiaceae bacterium]